MFRYQGFKILAKDKKQIQGLNPLMIKGVKTPIIGNICMDQCIIDVTNLDVKVGDEVVLFGGNNANGISIDSVAESLNTINYEIVCMVNKRVPRVFIQGEKIINIKDYILILSDL